MVFSLKDIWVNGVPCVSVDYIVCPKEFIVALCTAYVYMLTGRYMIRHLDHYLDYQREYRGGSCAPVKRFCARRLYLICGNRFGNYLVTLYLSIKVYACLQCFIGLDLCLKMLFYACICFLRQAHGWTK